MKKRLLIFIALFVFIQASNAQSQGAHPRGTWSEWHTVYSEQPNLKVEISFNTSTCKNGSLIGYSFWRIRSNFNRPMAYVKFTFDAAGCDGKVSPTLISYQLDKPGITDDLGDWFTGYEVRRIYKVTYADYTPKPTVTSTTGSSTYSPAVQKPIASTTTPTNTTSVITTGSNTTRSTNSNTSGGGTGSANSNAAIYNNLNRQLQTNQQNTQAVVNGLQQFGAALQQRQAERRAREDAADARREQQQAQDKAERDQRAAERLARVAEQNKTSLESPKETFYKGMDFDIQDKKKQAMQSFMNASAQGYAPATRMVSRLYELNKEYQEAVKWLKKAVNQDDLSSALLLGEIYELGEWDVEKNAPIAAFYYQIIIDEAKKNNLDALLCYSEMYEKGYGGLQKNISTAIILREKFVLAMMQNDPTLAMVSSCHLGELYEGVNNMDKAVYYYKEAAKVRLPDAIEALKRLSKL